MKLSLSGNDGRQVMQTNQLDGRDQVISIKCVLLKC